jgi:hypothetical protein
LFNVVPPVEFEFVGVVVPELAPPVVTSMLSIEMAAIVMSEVEPEVAGVFEVLAVWLVLAVVLDGVVLDGVVMDGVVLDVDPVPVAPVFVAPVLAVSVLVVLGPAEGVEAPVVLPPNAWSTSWSAVWIWFSKLANRSLPELEESVVDVPDDEFGPEEVADEVGEASDNAGPEKLMSTIAKLCSVIVVPEPPLTPVDADELAVDPTPCSQLVEPKEPPGEMCDIGLPQLSARLIALG